MITDRPPLEAVVVHEWVGTTASVKPITPPKAGRPVRLQTLLLVVPTAEARLGQGRHPYGVLVVAPLPLVGPQVAETHPHDAKVVPDAILECRAVPPHGPELVLALVERAGRPLADRVHKLRVLLAEIDLEKKIFICVSLSENWFFSPPFFLWEQIKRAGGWPISVHSSRNFPLFICFSFSDQLFSAAERIFRFCFRHFLLDWAKWRNPKLGWTQKQSSGEGRTKNSIAFYAIKLGGQKLSRELQNFSCEQDGEKPFFGQILSSPKNNSSTDLKS